MYPKPQPALRALQKRLPVRRKAVTVAIGMYCMGGAFVCADSHVVSDDGIVTQGYKLNGIECEFGTFAIANSSNDGNAANMVANEILKALARLNDESKIESAIKRTMGAWHSGYTHSAAPSMQFILAARVGQMARRLYFCEPPSTVLAKHLGEWVVIGVGGQIVEPLAPEVVRGPMRSREALMTAAYLMYRAKKDHIFLKGSDTHTLFVAQSGGLREITPQEMEYAESLGHEVDFMLRYCYLGLLAQPQGCDQREFLKSFDEKYSESRKKADSIQFPSLAGLMGI